MELFTARVCPYAHRTRLALLEKGVAFEHIEEDLSNKSERFLEVSPYGKVPALVHNGQTLYESLIINEYLDETFPDNPLMPEDPVVRAKARIWIHYCDAYFTTDFYAVIQNKDRAKDGELKEKLNARLRVAEQEGFGELSGNGPYWLGSEVSLVDLAWYPFFERLPAWTHYRDFRIPSDCPKIAAWARAMADRDSARQVANAPDYYIEGYARYAA